MWIVLNQLPGVIESGKGLIKVFVAERAAKTQTLDILMQRLDDDRTYYEKERVRLEKQISMMQKELDELRKKVNDRDEEISELKRRLS